MKVYIGNISPDMSDTQFSELVSPFGNNTANIAKDRGTGVSRGFGFADYPDDAHAQAAITGLNGREVHGQVLKVNESRPKGTRPATGTDLPK